MIHPMAELLRASSSFILFLFVLSRLSFIVHGLFFDRNVNFIFLNVIKHRHWIGFGFGVGRADGG
jgi:hypothetical protein